ncbi:hypothetical protein E2562_009308 [Oryza meyeriana var. granulata]|uniref:Uncharacterized protein n=1 Tax=Oryza meyeriana var. granulata TaxID=110450 RepID=A0A6G1CEX2_9ORYZ|nr:hypothetical protein E2562_009308 [Oryza meyeriana var. granulata]
MDGAGAWWSQASSEQRQLPVLADETSTNALSAFSPYSWIRCSPSAATENPPRSSGNPPVRPRSRHSRWPLPV